MIFNTDYLHELGVNGKKIDVDNEEDVQDDAPTPAAPEDTNTAEDSPTEQDDDTPTDDDSYQMDAGEDEPQEDTDAPDEDDTYNIDGEEDTEAPDEDTPTDDDSYGMDDDGSGESGDDGTDNDLGDGDSPSDEDSYTLDGGDEGDGDDASSDNGDDTDDTYSMDDSEGSDSTEEGETSGEATDDVNDGSADSSGTDLNNVENDIFSELTPEQQTLKNLELKGNYSTLYDDINSYIDRINKMDRNEDCAQVIERLMGYLLSMRDYVYQYLIKTYDTKSYIENQVVYQKMLVALNVVCNVLEELARNSSISKEKSK